MTGGGGARREDTRLVASLGLVDGDGTSLDLFSAFGFCVSFEHGLAFVDGFTVLAGFTGPLVFVDPNSRDLVVLITGAAFPGFGAAVLSGQFF